MFVNVPAYPPADFKGVVRSNFDTLYSIAWLDLTKEPMVISAPDTAGRYYLLPMLDMWTDVFASPGWRTTGTQAGNFLVRRLDGAATVPAGMTRISAPTPYVWIIGRTKTDGPAGLSCGSQDPGGLQGHAAVGMGQDRRAGPGEDRSEHRHEDAAQGSGRYHAGGQVLRLCGGTVQGQSAASDRRADPGADAAHRHRARPELRYRESCRLP